jgi:hypothetical protein
MVPHTCSSLSIPGASGFGGRTLLVFDHGEQVSLEIAMLECLRCAAASEQCLFKCLFKDVYQDVLVKRL